MTDMKKVMMIMVLNVLVLSLYCKSKSATSPECLDIIEI